MTSGRIGWLAGTAIGLVMVCAFGRAVGADSLSDEEAKAAYDRGVTRFMSGNYSIAADAFEKAMANDAMRYRAAKSLARVHIMRGRYEEAAETLAVVEPTDGDSSDERGDADWHLAMVEALEPVGEYVEALLHAEKANELAPLWAPTLLARGRVLETLGRNEEAAAVYETMDKVVADGSYRTDARSLVSLGEMLARHATLKGMRASEQANNIFNNYLQVAYQDVDAKYWPAHIVAGQFALSKHRFETAESEFNAALQQNRRLPDGLVGLAVVYLQQWQFEECMKQVRLALAVNPKHADALLVEALCLLQWRKIDQAPAVLEKILETNPNNLEALSLAAAAQIRLGADDAAQQYAERVREVNPQCEVLPMAIAEWLSAVRQFERAEQYYKEAVALAPHRAEPLTGLGELYMQTGQETEATRAFKKVHEIDDFRADVVNYLNLLDEMEGYETMETAHFVVKVSSEYDEVLLWQVAEEAENIYQEVCLDFQHMPSGKTMIEIFPTHPKFSVRLTGRGWLGTVGASTGPVIALVAPSEDRSMFGTYNWAVVLRHEFTHTVTLSATNNFIPHWFTEACAVWQQPDRRNFQAVGVLVEAVQADRLFKVKELDWGFIRPQRGGDRGLAYAQSEWMMEYIIETYKFDAVNRMLTGFAAGKRQSEVFTEVLGVTEEQFDRSFVAWARQKVDEWGFDARPMPPVGRLATAARRQPQDAGVQADYAVVLMRSGNIEQAEAVAKKTLELDEQNVKALGVMAGIELMKEEYAEAIDYALSLEVADDESPVAAGVLSESYLAEKEWSLAIIWLEQLKQRRPMDPRSYEKLAAIYIQLGLPEKALPNLEELHLRTMTDQEYARQVAEIYRGVGNEERALFYYEQITHINPYEASAYEAMAAIHRNARRYDQAVSSARCLTQVQPKSADAWAKLAMLRFVAARAAADREELMQAKQEAEKSIELDAEGPGGQVLSRIEDELADTVEKTPEQ